MSLCACIKCITRESNAYIKSDARNDLSNKALNAVLRMRTSGITVYDFHKDNVQMFDTFGIARKRTDKPKQNQKATSKGSPVKL